MNWDRILPWRSDGQSNDSTYEAEVIARCGHEWDEWAHRDDCVKRPHFGAGYNARVAEIEDGWLTFMIEVEEKRYCQLCGDAQYRVIENTGAIPLALQIDEGIDLHEALVEPVEPDADYVVGEDGETEVVSGEGEGRVLVNEAEQEVA